LDPRLLESLATGRTIALVSGTNGKTTTTRLLTEALGGAGRVATSSAGSNLPAGLVAALAAAPRAQAGVLEVDERHLPSAIAALRPAVVVLLNLSRDQLDRVGEVRMTAERWRIALKGLQATVVANADDPLVVWAAEPAGHVVYVAAGAEWHGDANHCPRCGATIAFAGRFTAAARSWSCPSCGFSRPELAAWLENGALRTGAGGEYSFELALPGRFNRGNAAIAAVAAESLGTGIVDALASASSVTDVEGRFSLVRATGAEVRLLLAKNPAGFGEILELVRPGSSPVVVGINARIADGHDPSWLWDVPFEMLAGHLVVATGERHRDLSVRLEHAGVAHVHERDQLTALEAAGPGQIDYLGNYTAFQEIRRRLRRGTWSPRPAPAQPRAAPALPHRGGGASKLRVVVVHPELLGTYGDSGNGLVLANRARWRGYGVELIAASSDDALPASADLYVLGGGEDGPQVRAVEVLAGGGLRRAVDGGAVVLAVCAGYQILGARFPGADGSEHAGLGLVDVRTVRGTPRAVGEILVGSDDMDNGAPGELTGFENHAGRTVRGVDVIPLGAVLLGIGNGDGTDGIVAGRIFGTYLHGPVLARNAAFADLLLSLAVGTVLEPLTDEEERALHGERLGVARGLSGARGRSRARGRKSS